MSSPRPVITCFVLDEGGLIDCQGAFQVEEETNTNTFRTNDGSTLEFVHLYHGTTCQVEVSGSKNGKSIAKLELSIPINRTKVKWKKVDFGTSKKLFYRSVYEAAA